MQILKAIGKTLNQPATLLVNAIIHKLSFSLTACISVFVIAIGSLSRARTKSQISTSH
ncbi:hypothetical protein [Paraglaciecola sp. 20A4]|uniref:hypothetical protein n=1 Tax=Paraglaciecola sp. 20A4 TaxID=2687288 RepID=UPI00140BE42F|nr:hypothetical protein [Paraglaciecola sp. 20A4]